MRRLLSVLLLLIVLPGAAWADGEPRFAGVEGALVHWRSWGKGDEAVLFIPGLTEDQTTFRHQIDAVRKSHRVIALDLPGHGDSGAPMRPYTFDLFAQAVLGVMDEAGVKRATLVGHSLGFPVALKVAQTAPARVAGIVSVDGAILLPAKTPAEKAAQEGFIAQTIAGLKGPNGQATLKSFMSSMLTKAKPEVRKEVLAKAEAAPLYMVSSVFENFGDPAVWAQRRYDMPLLAVLAQTSVTANPGMEDWLRARFPKADIQVWGDVDHFLQLEQSARLGSTINNFVR